MSSTKVQQIFLESGLEVLRRDVISSEWREHDIETGDQQALRDLLAIARLLRNESEGP